MADPKRLTEDELQALVAAEIADAFGGDMTELAAQRVKAMDYYQGRPFGNEVEGRSSVVSTDVRDTVEWIMPTLMRIFAGSDDVVEYEPTGPEDEAFAKQATEYGQHIWWVDNPGFINIYTNIKDALLQKNGIGKVWWDDSKIPKRDRLYGLDDAAFAMVTDDDDITVSEHTENEEEIELPTTAPGISPQRQKITTHDVVITRMTDGGRVCIEPVAPENFLISNDARDIKGARMVGDRKRVTISELREEGIDEEKIQRIIGGDAENTSVEEISRNTVEVKTGTTPPAVNESEQPVWRIECYVKADVDGDGVSEMRQVTVAGPGYTIIKNEPWDDERPYYGVTPRLRPHRFWGDSVADDIIDLQLIRSTLFRQYLDNAYVSNNQRLEVVESDIIDVDELLSSRPGGFVRVKKQGAITPIVVPQIGEAMLAGLAYVDQIREMRTGVSERTQGLGADPLHETMGGEQMLMTAAMGKIELIARVMAVGFEDAFRLILGLTCRYQQKPRIIRLTNKWATIDPRSWNSEMDVSISVGMGTGDNQQKLVHANVMGQAQQSAAMSGLLKVTPDNAMETATLLVNAMGLKNPERFFTKPQPGEPPPPNPAMEKVKADAQLGQAKLQSEAQLAQAKAQMTAQTDLAKAQAKAQADHAHAQAQAQVDHLHNVMESQREANKANQQMMLEQMKAIMDQKLELQLAHIKGAVAIEVARIGAKADDGKAAYQRESAGE